MIATLTINPAFDKICYVDDFRVNKVQRVTREATVIGGKGINISVMLKNFGVPSIAMGFVGGIMGTKLEVELRRLGIITNFVRTESDTRTNVFIIDRQNDTLTVINVSGHPVFSEDLDLLRDRFQKVLNQVHTVILAGSLLPDMEIGFYGELVGLARGRQVRTIVHTAPRYLEAAVDAEASVVFPDMRSTDSFLGRLLDTPEACIACGQAILTEHQNIDLVIFSHLVTDIVAVARGKAYVFSQPDLHYAHLLGFSGAIIAGFVYGSMQQKPLRDALSLGSMAGYACVSEQDKFCDFLEILEQHPPPLHIHELAL